MRKSVAISTFLLFLILLTFLPRVLSLSKHWSSDETKWLLRSRDFFSALQNRQFEDTYVTHHPGITTCWLGTVAIWYRYHRDSSFRNWLDSDRFISPETLADIRLPITVVTGILIFFAGFLIYRLFGRETAGLGTLFLAVEPFLVSESRRAHTDALMSLFLFLSLLLWLCYLESESPRRRDLILSGICFTFACLTKSLAVGFILFLPILLGWYIERGVSWVKLIWSGLLWMMSATLTIILAWPYLWTIKFTPWNIPMFPILFVGCSMLLFWSSRKLSRQISLSLTRREFLILGYSLLMIILPVLYAVNTIVGGMYWALTEANWVPTLFLGDIRYNPGMFYFPVMWFVWSTPLTFPLIGTAIYFAWQQRHHAQKSFRIIVVLGCFVLFYLIGLSLIEKKISRYIVVFLPVVSLLTALGAIQVAHLFKKKRFRFLFIVVVVAMQIAPVLRLHPYYRTYHYPFLSKKWVVENTSSITGVGLSLAADYLNALPNVEGLRVRLTLFTEDLTHYFVGNTTPRYLTQDNTGDFDYDVEHLYDRQIKGIPVDLPPRDGIQLYTWDPSQELSRELEHVVRLNGIDYVWIYRVLKQ